MAYSASQITTHVADAQSRLLQQYKDKPNILSIVEIFTTQTQGFENAVYTLFNFIDIDTAGVEWLNRIGVIIGQLRLNNTDEIYRALIRAKIGKNTSSGIYDDIASIWKILTVSSSITFTELDYASIAIWSEVEAPAAVQSLILGFIDSAVAGGIQVSEVGVYAAVDPFIFESITMGTLEGKGFGSITGGETDGGKLGKIYV